MIDLDWLDVTLGESHAILRPRIGSYDKVMESEYREAVEELLAAGIHKIAVDLDSVYVASDQIGLAVAIPVKQFVFSVADSKGIERSQALEASGVSDYRLVFFSTKPQTLAKVMMFKFDRLAESNTWLHFVDAESKALALLALTESDERLIVPDSAV
ncbi:MAG: hypothetical protein KBG20_03835 [Caldilineaceae bacterium]|nr:hypothetical protein [Caldilineaceae bacterium]MBP8106544.1 hypothetical protein [Caldilineaceae bacterium]MBP8121566.1 hypothetical protein [Caldilineaceae bacterium]MBP9071399.1 hypothetical protein [Caldilineaceae bacterium]